MRIGFALTKEYDVWIDKEEVDKKYCGNVREAIADKLNEAEETDTYIDDIEVIEEEYEYQDVLYDDMLQDEYEREKELQESLYLRDLI